MGRNPQSVLSAISKNKFQRIFLLCLAVLLAFSFVNTYDARSAAQNKVITKRFKWKMAQSEHFDIHYYPEAERFLPVITQNLERSFERVTKILGVSVKERTPFFFFLDHNQFEQNNIVDVDEGTGGVTEAFKNRLLIFHDGTLAWLYHVVPHEFTHVCQFTVLYGGFWKSARLLKSPLYPLWFMEGMAEYTSGDIDEVEKEMVIRDAVTSKIFVPISMLHGFNHLKPHQVTMAYKTGEAAFDYIAREYGQEKIGAMLKVLADKFDIGSVMQEVLGVSFHDFDARFTEYLEEKYADEAADRKEPEFYGRPLTVPDNVYPVFNTNPVLFPDGRKFAYISDKEGFPEIYVYDLALARYETLNIQRRFSNKVENISSSGNALSISPDGRYLLFAAKLKQKDFLYIYDMKRERLKKISYDLEGLQSPQFSPDGKSIAFVGMQDGLNDIYISDRDGRFLKKITDTFDDENYVAFFPDGKSIVFSRETSVHNTLRPYERDLWVRSLETGKETRLTSMPGNETEPAVSPAGDEVIFVGDESGVNDLYKVPASGGKPVKLTNVMGGNFFPRYFPDGKNILFVSYRRNEQHIYLGLSGNPAPVADASSSPAAKISKKQPVKEKEPEQKTAFAGPISFRGGRPYKFRASTDFFFPVMFYSSTDGLYLSTYWQASEMLGNHQLQAQFTYASAYDFLNYQVSYVYLRWRPQFFVGFVGDNTENIFITESAQRREDSQFAGVVFPFNRYDSIQYKITTTQRKIQFTDDQFVTFREAGRENVSSISFRRDVSRGRYMETTSGYRIQASCDESDATQGSSLDYRDVFLEYNHFLPMHKESSFAFRLFSGASFGTDTQYFRTGGSDMLRGFGRYDPNYAASRFVVTNTEYRFPIFFDTNYHIWFFFPDFLFKNVYGSVFMDNGILWNSGTDLGGYALGDVKNSFGIGLRVQTFILQTYPLMLQLDWARRTRDGEQVFYFGLGPNF